MVIIGFIRHFAAVECWSIPRGSRSDSEARSEGSAQLSSEVGFLIFKGFNYSVDLSPRIINFIIISLRALKTPFLNETELVKPFGVGWPAASQACSASTKVVTS